MKKSDYLVKDLINKGVVTEREANEQIWIVGKIENLTTSNAKRHTLNKALIIGKRLAGKIGHCQLSMSKYVGHLSHYCWIYPDKIYY